MNRKIIPIILLFSVVSVSIHAENLFVSLLGKSEEEVNERLQQVWRHFFTPADLDRSGANDEKSVYYEGPNGTAFILDTGNNDVRSEGMSYGMMISVQLDHREQFDKLWEWSKRYMAFAPDSKWDGYFCWQCKPDGTKLGGSNASDGELYYVTALFLASERWNEPHYSEEANKILTKVMNKDGRKSGVFNLYNYDNGLITFVPDRMGYDFTDPSYHLPAFLDKWARTALDNRLFWKKAATEARRHLVISAHPETGLYPDYSLFDGKAYAWPHATYDTSIYMYDAIRCPMNIGMDYYLCGKDCQSQEIVMNRLLTFFKKDGFKHGHFTLDGSKAFGQYSCGMAGANAVGAITLAHSNVPEHRELAREYVQRLWDIQPPVGKFRYYEGLVYFLSMLHVSGRFSLDF
ncbi:glycosyl hydrolase family 8 [Bacteroides congonensis]